MEQKEEGGRGGYHCSKRETETLLADREKAKDYELLKKKRGILSNWKITCIIPEKLYCPPS